MDDIWKIGGLLVCFCFVSSLAFVDWQFVLTGSESEIVIDVVDPSPSPSPDPKVIPTPMPSLTPVPTPVPILKLDLNITKISWGDSLDPGENRTQAVLLTNSGNIPGKFIELITENWNPPAAQSFMFLSWDLDGFVLGAQESVVGNFTLHVDPLIQNVTNFSFDIRITLVQD